MRQGFLKRQLFDIYARKLALNFSISYSKHYMISNYSISRRGVLTIFNHPLEYCDKVINCFTSLLSPIPEPESFKRSVFPRTTIIFEFLQHQFKLLFILVGSKFKGVTDFRAVFPMQCKKSPLPFSIFLLGLGRFQTQFKSLPPTLPILV